MFVHLALMKPSICERRKKTFFTGFVVSKQPKPQPSWLSDVGDGDHAATRLSDYNYVLVCDDCCTVLWSVDKRRPGYGVGANAPVWRRAIYAVINYHNRLETLILDFILETRPNSTVRLQACMSGRKCLFLFGGNHIAWSCILRILLSRFQKPSSILRDVVL